MCLVSESKIPTKSSYNIIIYKVLALKGKQYVSPFKSFSYIIGETISDIAKENIIEMFDGVLAIESGFFHAHKSVESAKVMKENLERVKKGTYVIFEGEIPERTLFYEGQFGDICAKSIKLTKQID